MKTFFLALLSIFIISSCSANPLWINDYNKALQLAKEQRKDIYLFIGADSCVYCDRYKKNTLSKRNVIKTLQEDYILLYLSRDQHFIPEKFCSSGVPKHYFLTKDGKIIFDTFGMPEPAGLFLILDEVDLHKDD